MDSEIPCLCTLLCRANSRATVQYELVSSVQCQLAVSMAGETALCAALAQIPAFVARLSIRHRW